jgi:hypothetical protein
LVAAASKQARRAVGSAIARQADSFPYSSGGADLVRSPLANAAVAMAIIPTAINSNRAHLIVLVLRKSLFCPIASSRTEIQVKPDCCKLVTIGLESCAKAHERCLHVNPFGASDTQVYEGWATFWCFSS